MGDIMTDRIRLSRIGVFAYHGLHPEETRMGQRFFISIECGLDLRPAGTTDDFTRTADYHRMAEMTQEIAVGRQFKTIEALAEAVAGAVLAEFPPVQTVTVTVEKPSAPIPAMLDTVSVEITRQRVG